tara:strand:- start:12 stop:146 length:135 start_codon:yes stop_codon:yes gene_type:complete
MSGCYDRKENKKWPTNKSLALFYRKKLDINSCFYVTISTLFTDK